jgi:2'-5' RNA ligase
MTTPELNRRQASMYLHQANEIEELRLRFNPIQARLIPAHVTLCREDEIADWQQLAERINRVMPIRVTIGFGCPVREGNLVMLPAVSGVEQFDQLREELIADGSKKPRKQSPHITIIHPRNGTCTDVAFAEISNRLQPFEWTFQSINLIEQTDGGPWKTLAKFG